MKVKLVWKGLRSINLLFVKVKSTIESEIGVERVAEYRFTVCESEIYTSESEISMERGAEYKFTVCESESEI